MIRVVRLDLEPSFSTAERLDAAFARARELDDGVSPHVVGIVEFPLSGDGSVLMRIDRADLFMHDQSTADVSRDELQALRQWMLLNKDDVVMRRRCSVRAKPLNPGEIRWSGRQRGT